MFVGKFEFFNIKDGFVWILIRKRNVINKILKKKERKIQTEVTKMKKLILIHLYIVKQLFLALEV